MKNYLLVFTKWLDVEMMGCKRNLKVSITSIR